MTELITRPLDPLIDALDLITLFEETFGETISPWMWQWKYVPPWATRYYCWVARIDDRTIGYMGAVPLPGQVRGEHMPFFQLADFMVHPDYRRQFDYFDLGAKRIVADIVDNNPRHLLYGFSSHRAFLWFKKLGLSDLVEKAQTRYLRRAACPRAHDVEFSDLAWDDPKLDELWDRHSPQYEVSLVRDRQYLSWRYEKHPINNYRLLGVQRSGEVIGWVVVANDGAGLQGRPPEHPVIDLVLPNEDIRSVLAALTHHLDGDVMVWLAGHVADRFPEEVNSGTNVFHFTGKSPFDTQLLEHGLYYTMGDVDWW